MQQVYWKARLALEPIAVFEVLSADAVNRDCVEKTRDYAAVPSIRNYIIADGDSIGLISMPRHNAGDDWTVTALTAGDTLTLPEFSVTIPIAEFYEDVAFTEDQASR